MFSLNNLFGRKPLGASKGLVAVGLSGGVDSSVAAALLKDQGYEVIGIFMYFWKEEGREETGQENVCCSLAAKEDARRVADKLGIKLYTMNMAVDFKRDIVDNFVESYKEGRTPNPCVRCNRYIKFGQFVQRAKSLGADLVATGHYAQVKKINKFLNKPRKTEGGVEVKVKLLRGQDQRKDQSYFLHQLAQLQLQHILFPVGKMNKKQVRRLAVKYGLSTASKKESQEICFIPDGDVSNFLSRQIEFKKGQIKEVETGKVLGEHEGLPGYTLGQRKGIGLAGGPWYVVKMTYLDNVLWVSTEEKLILQNELVVKNVNWITGEPKFPLTATAEIRYHGREVKVKVEPLVPNRSEARAGETEKDVVGRRYVVKFEKPQRAVTPGQYCVLYHRTECLGGGEIC